MDWTQTSNATERLLSLASFSAPEYTCESAWADHAPFAFWLIDAFRPRTVVELGTHRGYSYFAFCQAVKAAELGTRCYAVDTWQGDEHTGFYEEDVFTRVSDHNERTYAAFSRLVRSTFDEALAHFADGSIDLLHIDGRHFYDDVKHDFEAWRPKLSDRAVVLFHDTNVRERGFQVFRLWEELRASYPTFEFGHGHGLGVLGYGKMLPEAMTTLFAAARDPEETRKLRHIYARLGAAFKSEMVASLRITKQAQRVEELERDNRHLTESMARFASSEQLNVELQAEKARLAAAQEEIQKLISALNEQRAEMDELKKEQKEHLDTIYSMSHSRSWRLTEPFRTFGTKLGLLRFAQKVYFHLPLPLYVKRSLRDAAFMLLAPFIHNTVIYHNWRRSNWRWQRVQAVRRAVRVRLKSLREVARPLEIDYSAAVPFGYLPPTPTTAPRLAVVCHMFFETQASEFRRYFENMTIPFDLFVSTDSATKQAIIQDCFRNWRHGAFEVRLTPNQGRDIAPKLIGFRDVYDSYDLVLHLHSKASEHANILENWRGSLLENLIGSPAIVNSVLDIFARHPDVGLVAAQHFEPARRFINWGENFKNAKRLAERMGITALSPKKVLDFPSGSMFWARTAALKPLLDLELEFEDFGPERAQIDGTLAHAIERLYYYVCERAGFRWVKIANPRLFGSTPAIFPVETPDDLDTFVKDRTIALTGPNLPAPRLTLLPPALAAAGLASRLHESALGSDRAVDLATNVAIGIVTYNNEERQLRRLLTSARRALARAGLSSAGRIFVLENGETSPIFAPSDGTLVILPPVGNVGFGAGHNKLMREAFARGADIYIAVNPDGAFHPDAILALVQMSLAHYGRALIEALQFPSEHPKPYHRFNFETNWASGACLAIPRPIYEQLGGFDETFFMYSEDVDLSWRARANNFMVRTCPRALFLHAVTNRASNPKVLQMIYSSAVLLARKWGSPAFETWATLHLQELHAPVPEAHPTPVPPEWRRVTDFGNRLTFAKARWS